MFLKLKKSKKGNQNPRNERTGSRLRPRISEIPHQNKQTDFTRIKRNLTAFLALNFSVNDGKRLRVRIVLCMNGMIRRIILSQERAASPRELRPIVFNYMRIKGRLLLRNMFATINKSKKPIIKKSQSM